MFNLDGKVAIVTGSTRGIGLSIAEHFARAGAKVVISSRNAEACEQVAQSIRADGGEAIGVACNVRRKEQLEALVKAALDAWGRIDVLVCNAATNTAFGPLATIEDEAYEVLMRTNVTATLWLCNMALPHIAKTTGGSVIVVSSIAALRGSAALAAYGMSKAAEAALVRSLAVEWGPRGVRVNAIAPGLIRTEFARALWEDPERRARAEGRTPLRRIGEPDDIGGVALFLASDAARYVTGEMIVADGGETIA
jgi:NAD(P)-dependent dehydrogenase (short-subunit alcohol dehydrogenase family)